MDSDDENLVIPHGAHAAPRDPALAGAVMPSELGYETEWDAFQLSIARYTLNRFLYLFLVSLKLKKNQP